MQPPGPVAHPGKGDLEDRMPDMRFYRLTALAAGWLAVLLALITLVRAWLPATGAVPAP